MCLIYLRKHKLWIYSQWRKNIPKSQCQYRGCWWPGTAGSHSINSHGIDLILQKYSCFNTRAMALKAMILSRLSQNIPHLQKWWNNCIILTVILPFPLNCFRSAVVSGLWVCGVQKESLSTESSEKTTTLWAGWTPVRAENIQQSNSVSTTFVP